MSTWTGAVVATIVVGLWPAAALSVDGVGEIDQSCAEQTGCFADDQPGFPVTIGSPGSYILTGPLTVTGGSGTAILFNASSVRLDLNGFSILGNSELAGDGLEATIVLDTPPTPLREGYITVRNGSVGGFPGACLNLGPFSRAEDLNVANCDDGGIVLGEHGLARRNMISFNGGARAGLEGPRSMGYADNQLASNAVDVRGGTPLGVNVCTGGRTCARFPPLRRFYVSSTSVLGGGVLDACADGFHAASLHEILDPSNLRCDNELAGTADPGPPGSGGSYFWVRTNGGSLGFCNNTAGRCDCQRWASSDPSEIGTAVLLRDDWIGTSASQISPWTAGTFSCGDDRAVWCVED